jgi:hypothetical protein
MKTMKTTKQAKKLFKPVIAAAIAGISLTGCGTITNAHVHHMSNTELVLAHYQVINRLSGPHYFSGRAFDDGDISSDTRERQAIERELMRRGLLNPLPTPQDLRPMPEKVF